MFSKYEVYTTVQSMHCQMVICIFAMIENDTLKTNYNTRL